MGGKKHTNIYQNERKPQNFLNRKPMPRNHNRDVSGVQRHVLLNSYKSCKQICVSLFHSLKLLCVGYSVCLAQTHAISNNTCVTLNGLFKISDTGVSPDAVNARTYIYILQRAFFVLNETGFITKGTILNNYIYGITRKVQIIINMEQLFVWLQYACDCYCI